MVCVQQRGPRSNIWSALEDQALSIGLAFHRCETSNLDSVFQNLIPFLIVATSCSSSFVFVGSDLQPLAHTTKFPSRRESMAENEQRMKTSQLDNERFVYTFFPISSLSLSAPWNRGSAKWNTDSVNVDWLRFFWLEATEENLTLAQAKKKGRFIMKIQRWFTQPWTGM